MKLIVCAIFAAVVGAAEPVTLPAPLFDAPMLGVPNGAWGGIYRTGPGPEPIPAAPGMASLLSALLTWPAESVLSAQAAEWNDSRQILEQQLNGEEFDYFYASQVQCPAPKCIVFGATNLKWLITVGRNLRVVDAELIAGAEDEEIPENERTGTQRFREVAILDTPFGYGGDDKPTDFASTGFFCSDYLHEREPSQSRSYKRLVSPDGTITSKQIDRWDDCRLPW